MVVSKLFNSESDGRIFNDKLLGNLQGRSSHSLRFRFFSNAISNGFKGDLLKGEILLWEFLHGDRNKALLVGLFCSFSTEKILEVPTIKQLGNY